MARYINEDEFVAWVKEHWCSDCQNDNGLRCRACWIDDAIDIVEEAPEADVAPRADFADQKARADMCAEVIARQDKEIEKLQDKVKRYKRYYFHHDYDKMIAEVLDELDRFINSNCIEIKDERGIKGYVTSGIHFAISDFKKKYTGESP